MVRKIAIPVALAGITALAAPATGQDVDLDDPTRPAEEKARDAHSKPLEMLAWLEVGEGDVVLDFHAGGGYNTWVLSKWVGPAGVVFTEASGRRAEGLVARLETGDLADAGNVVHVEALSEVADDTLDLFLTVRNYHDVDVERIPEFLGEVKRTLKPGGTFAVVDARAAEGRDEEAHRIADAVIVAEATAAGFEHVASSELLANAEDDHQGADWETRDQVDQSLLRFRAPAGGHAHDGEHEGH